jgi:thiol:disulfide interchange protein DsbA
MQSRHLKWISLLGLLTTGFASLAIAQQVSLAQLPPVTTLVKDRDFRELPTPQRTTVPDGDIEVIGFFHYGSPWVGQVAPYVQAWADQAGPRVHFQWAPAVLADNWGWGARVYYALDEMGQADNLNVDLMVAYGSNQLADGDNGALVNWLTKKSVDGQKFLEVANGGKVIARTTWVPTIMSMYDLRTVPTFVINGRYVVESSDSVPPLVALARTRYIVENLLKAENPTSP